jgi:hypothetical protein
MPSLDYRDPAPFRGMQVVAAPRRLLLLLLLAGAPGGISQSCSSYTSCSTCTGSISCQWCLPPASTTGTCQKVGAICKGAMEGGVGWGGVGGTIMTLGHHLKTWFKSSGNYIMPAYGASQCLSTSSVNKCNAKTDCKASAGSVPRSTLKLSEPLRADRVILPCRPLQSCLESMGGCSWCSNAKSNSNGFCKTINYQPYCTASTRKNSTNYNAYQGSSASRCPQVKEKTSALVIILATTIPIFALFTGLYFFHRYLKRKQVEQFRAVAQARLQASDPDGPPGVVMLHLQGATAQPVPYANPPGPGQGQPVGGPVAYYPGQVQPQPLYAGPGYYGTAPPPNEEALAYGPPRLWGGAMDEEEEEGHAP